MTSGRTTFACPMCGHAFEHDIVDRQPPPVCPACGTALGHGDGGYAAVDLEDARQRVRWPAVGLMIVGVLVVLGSAVFPLLLGWLFVVDPPLQDNGDDDRLGMFMILATTAATGLAGAAVGGLIAYGGFRMYHLQSHTVVVIAATFAIVVVFGSCLALCCPFAIAAVAGLPGLPVGIWALVVLNQPNVQAAFRVTEAAARSGSGIPDARWQ